MPLIGLTLVDYAQTIGLIPVLGLPARNSGLQNLFLLSCLILRLSSGRVLYSRPRGVRLPKATTRVYKELTGLSEVWLSEYRRPLRQALKMEASSVFPEALLHSLDCLTSIGN